MTQGSGDLDKKEAGGDEVIDRLLTGQKKRKQGGGSAVKKMKRDEMRQGGLRRA